MDFNLHGFVIFGAKTLAFQSADALPKAQAQLLVPR
jgi:hypothetical protein